MLKKSTGIFLALLLLTASFSEIGSAKGSTAQSFPIGIFWPPSPANTSSASYADISAMNATFIVGGNGLSDYSSNDAALGYAANHGLTLLVDDSRLAWRDQVVSQNNSGHGLSVSSTLSLGQTIRTPKGTGWGLNQVQLQIDQLNWPAGAAITLHLYDSPAKNQLIASDTLTAPVSTFYPVFNLHTAVQSDNVYYLEVTSDSPTPIGWITTSTSSTYEDGQAYLNGVAQSVDLWFNLNFSQRAYNDGNQPSDTAIDDIANYYGTKAAVLGYHILDEPTALQMTRIQNTIRRLKMNDSSHLSFVNLFPNYATASQLGLNQFTGEFVTDTVSLGQTFTTKKGQTQIDSVQWWIDKNTWGAGEELTLKLWNSPAKTTLIAQHTSSAPNTEWPLFHLNASVLQNTQYYMELTHNGGGDGSIGWVVRSNTNDNWYNDGSAYLNGTPIEADFWFTINQNIKGASYEDYVYRWMYTEPDVLVFDHYPFLANGQFRNDYYDNLETIRRQAKLGGVDFWSYIQSVGVTSVWKAPSESEMRYQIYANLAYGAKGYIYFTYWTPEASGGESFNNGLILPDGTKNASYLWAQNLNAEVLQLGNTLMELQSLAVYHTGNDLPSSTTILPASFAWQPNSTVPLVIGQYEDQSGQQYVMIVNKSTVNQHTIPFTADSSINNVKEVSKVDGQLKATNFNNGGMSVQFAPGEGKLFRLE